MFRWFWRKFMGGFDAIEEARERTRNFTIRPHEDTEWGTVFAGSVSV